MKNVFTALLLTAGLLSNAVLASEYNQGELSIIDPYTRTTPPSAPVAGGFMTITNNGTEADTLLGGTVDFAEVVEIHEMPMVDGVMRMRQLENGLEIPPGETVELKPGGYHVMFIKLSEPMKEGDKHAATLNFAKAGEVEVELEVKDINTMMNHKDHGKQMDHSQHGDMQHGKKMAHSGHGKTNQGGHGQNMQKMLHVNPLPNLMRIVVHQGDELGLSEKQQSKLKDWRENSHPEVQKLVQEVIQAEQKLLEIALDEASDQDELQKQYAIIAEKRQQIAMRKMACRENMKEVLSAEQFRQVIDSYQQEFAGNHNSY